MNDEQRAALVDAFTQVVFSLESPDYDWHLQPAEDQYRTRRYAEEWFDDTLAPIIDRLLAEHNIDAMLNAVHPYASIDYFGQETLNGEWNVDITYPQSLDHDGGWDDQAFAHGTGPTRTAAIADACRKAMEGRATNDR